MAAAKWRTRRMWGYESRTLAHGAAEPDTPAEFRSVLAWERKLTQVEGCQRYETRAQRHYDRALAQLRDLQLERALLDDEEEAPPLTPAAENSSEILQNKPGHPHASPPVPPS